MAKAANLKLNFVAKSIGIHFFGVEDIFRCYRDNENLKIHFGRMDTLSSFYVYLRRKALISEVTVEQQIVPLICYVSVALIRKIAKRTRILTFDWGHWHALRDFA